MAEPAIDADEAAAALASVRATQRRSAEMRGYGHAGRHLIAWGLVWLAGNLAAQFMPERAPVVWGAAMVIAILFQLLAAGARTDWRVLATVAAGLGFFASAVVTSGIPPAFQTAFASLVVAAIYVGLGIWAGLRFAWLGMVLAAIILVARFAWPAWLPLSLGVGGGGALILSGLWLRRA